LCIIFAAAFKEWFQLKLETLENSIDNEEHVDNDVE